MKGKTGKTKAIVMSALTIGCCGALIVGATVAAFTSSQEYSFNVQSGEISISSALTLDSMSYRGEADSDATSVADNAQGDGNASENAITLENGYGSAAVNGEQITMTLAQGTTADFTLTVENASTVAMKYVAYLSLDGNASAYTFGGGVMNGTGSSYFLTQTEGVGGWVTAGTAQGQIAELSFHIGLAWAAAPSVNSEITLVVRAVQANAADSAEIIRIQPTEDAADNGVALAQALERASEGTDIYLGAGDYELSGAVSVPAGVNLYGAQAGVPAAQWANEESAEKTIITAPAAASNRAVLIEGSNVVVDGILVDGSGNTSDFKGIKTQSSDVLTNVVVRNSAVINCNNDAIDVGTANGAVIENNYIENVKDCAIILNGYQNDEGVTTYIRNNVVDGVNNTSNGAIAVCGEDVPSKGDVVISGNTVRNVANGHESSMDVGEDCAIFVEKVNEGGVIIIENNIIEDSAKGIAVYKFTAQSEADRVIVRNNIVRDAQVFAIATSHLNEGSADGAPAVVVIEGNNTIEGETPSKGSIYIQTKDHYGLATAGWEVVVNDVEIDSSILGDEILEDEIAVIYRTEDLKALSDQVGGGSSFIGKTVILVNDIDLSGISWAPIGKDTSAPFSGTFDGNGKTIGNLTVNMEGSDFVGLFGYVTGGALIQNFTVENAKVTGRDRVGVIVGDLYTRSTVDNVHVVGAKVTAGHWAGGIVGYTYCNITNCSVTDSEISAVPYLSNDSYDNGDKVGGIVGQAFSSVITGNIVFDVTLNAYRDVGGIVGQLAKDGVVPTFTGNYARNVTISIDQLTYSYGLKDENHGKLIGRLEADTGLPATWDTTDNTFSGTYSVTAKLADGFTYEEDADTAAYPVSNVPGLLAFAEKVNAGNAFIGKTVILVNDIDLSGISWTPIGQGMRSGSGLAEGGKSFSGTFDGNGKTVSNLTFSGAYGDDNAFGLIGVLNGGVVKDLTLANVSVNVTDGECVGAVAGLMINGATVSGVTVESGSVTAVRGNGGIVGRMTVSGTIENCNNLASITATSVTSGNVGGIVGAAYYRHLCG